MAKVGDEITTFTGSNQLRSDPVVIINPDSDASIASVAQGSNATQWAANYIKNDDTEGALTFSIAFQDLAATGDTWRLLLMGRGYF